MTPHIETFTGRTFNVFDPAMPDIRVEDLAHALANQCRFSGHVRYHYSVAEHCVRVAELLARRRFSPTVQLWGLIHDASEAYLVDLPSPIKRSDHAIGEAYKTIERGLMTAICRRFSLPEDEPAAVRLADADMLATEVRDLMHGERPYWGKLEGRPVSERIRPWSPAVAEGEYLRAYQALTGAAL